MTISIESQKREENRNPVFLLDKQDDKLADIDPIDRLNKLLQTTLEIENLIALFFNTIKNVLAIDGLRYLNNTHHITTHAGRPEPLQIFHGDQTIHSCAYQILNAEENLGEIIFFRKKRFKEREISKLEDLTTTLIYPLRNALQYRLVLQTALKDPLTGARNRVSLNATIKRELNLAQRRRTGLSLLIVDVDDFKQVNDSYGHLAGDQVLVHIVNKIFECVRGTDIVYRFGGDEFIVVLSETKKQDAMLIASRLTQLIAAEALEYNGKQINVSVSIGVGSCQKEDSPGSLLDRADRALYKVKQSRKD